MGRVARDQNGEKEGDRQTHNLTDRGSERERDNKCLCPKHILSWIPERILKTFSICFDVTAVCLVFDATTHIY